MLMSNGSRGFAIPGNSHTYNEGLMFHPHHSQILNDSDCNMLIQQESADNTQFMNQWQHPQAVAFTDNAQYVGSVNSSGLL